MPKKLKTIYVCSKCDSQFPKWQGRCTECGAWGKNEMQNAKIKMKNDRVVEVPPGEIEDFEKIEVSDFKRIKVGINELDRVLGGGIVPGSLALIGGEPGIGKSTLVLQMADKLAKNSGKNILYVSGEESAHQIKTRFDRLSLAPKNIKYLGETNIETVSATIEKHKPLLAIVDSIQTMYSEEIPSEAGSVSQIRTSTVKLMEVAKKSNIPVVIIGHVTKEGAMAGPKTLEHLVGTVLYLEGDQYHAYRLLRAVKNRFGSTNEVGVFDMQEKGLVEVENPSEMFLAERDVKKAGSVVTAIIEGSRAFLIEIQALISPSSFSYPQRRTSGFDFNRLQLLTAVLSQRLRLNLNNKDIHINVVGGFRVKEPAVDLAVCLAVISAFKNKPVDSYMVVLGEVGLGGELRSVSHLEKRLTEAEKLGFKKILLPVTRIFPRTSCQLVKVKSLEEVVNIIK